VKPSRGRAARSEDTGTFVLASSIGHRRPRDAPSRYRGRRAGRSQRRCRDDHHNHHDDHDDRLDYVDHLHNDDHANNNDERPRHDHVGTDGDAECGRGQ
jgi:hypothetical protein